MSLRITTPHNASMRPWPALLLWNRPMLLQDKAMGEFATAIALNDDLALVMHEAGIYSVSIEKLRAEHDFLRWFLAGDTLTITEENGDH